MADREGPAIRCLGMFPDLTNGPGYEHNGGHPMWAFDPDVIEYVRFEIEVPLDFSSNPRLRVKWSDSGASAPGASVDAVVFAAQMEHRTPNADSDASDAVTYGTANTATDEADNTNPKALMEVDIDLDATDFDSGAANDIAKYRLYRNATDAADTLANDAWVQSVKFVYDDGT